MSLELILIFNLIYQPSFYLDDYEMMANEDQKEKYFYNAHNSEFLVHSCEI